MGVWGAKNRGYLDFSGMSKCMGASKHGGSQINMGCAQVKKASVEGV